MIYEMLTCGACRTCEIACSYHHTGEFVPSLSSIKIYEKESGEGYIVELLEEDHDRGKGCDGCVNLKEPLCMEVCKDKESLEKMIHEVLQRRKSERLPGLNTAGITLQCSVHVAFFCKLRKKRSAGASPPAQSAGRH